MKTCLLHAENRRDALWKEESTQSKPQKLLSLKAVKKTVNNPTGRRINTRRVDPSVIHEQRVLFNKQHFCCKEFHHQDGKKTWMAPVSKKETPAITIKRIVQILVPSNFFYVTDKTRKRTVCKRDVHHRVISAEEAEIHITAHGENAVKEMLLKAGVNKDFIMTKKNVCYVTLHKQVSEEKLRDLFPTLHIRVFKVKKHE